MLSPLLILVTFFALASCSTERNYYLLSPVGKPPSGGGIGIGVGPVTMADYLVERPYLVFQSTPNKMEISDLHEWGGDLRNDFTRVLASNLGRRKGTGNIRTYPWERENELKYQITVDVRQFHGTADGDALLEASWRAYELPGSRLIASKTSTLREPITNDGFEELAAAQSRLIDKLAAAISKEL
ncbi:MAG: putative lipoprotein YmbA [Akkermansiaceae bacterium]|jgi:uncharacterized lipoprotein YmbA